MPGFHKKLVIFFLGAVSAQASLIGSYSFNGNANDSSGSGNNGTVNGTVSYVYDATLNQEVLSLDGSSTNNFISVPIDSSVGGQPTETFGGWFYVPVGDATSVIRGMISVDDGGFDRTVDEDNRNGGIFQWSAFDGAGPVAGGAVGTGVWTFVAVSYNNSGGDNGTYTFEVGTNQYTGNTSFDGNSVTGTTYIGVNPNFNSEFQGEIADVFFYNNAETASQLLTIEQTTGPHAPAPEPSTIVLAAAGLAGLIGWSRRSSRAA